MGITHSDEQFAQKWERTLEAAFISGSYLTNPDTANDIDLVIPNATYEMMRKEVEEHFEREEHEVAEKYQEADQDGEYELVCCWRKEGVNLIVVNNRFYPAYLAASVIMQEQPQLFDTREKRVLLHTNLKNHIRQMFTEYAWSKFSSSPVAVQVSSLE